MRGADLICAIVALLLLAPIATAAAEVSEKAQAHFIEAADLLGPAKIFVQATPGRSTPAMVRRVNQTWLYLLKVMEQSGASEDQIGEVVGTVQVYWRKYLDDPNAYMFVIHKHPSEAEEAIQKGLAVVVEDAMKTVGE
ncbi:MAG: hypothetical protein RLW87_20620 [Alphaproteobacteria bacterium]